MDHVAIGLERWSDAYDRFIRDLGGRYERGGPAGDFAPYQLGFGDCMLVEFIAPDQPGGFMERFLERNGPSAHHITFKVPSIEDTIETLQRHGYETFGGRPDMAVFREAFVHPKLTGLGTLLQIIEVDEQVLSGEQSRTFGRPADLPDPTGPARTVALFGLTVTDLARARELFEDALRGAVLEDGADWFLVNWGPGRGIVVRRATVTPGGEHLWPQNRPQGVEFLLFGPGDLTVSDLSAQADELIQLPHDARIGVPVWLFERNSQQERKTP